MNASLPKIGTLWVGPNLPHIERMCISSMAAQGHDVTLYAYEDIDAPAGVTVTDASSILPRESIFTYKKTGSYATFADWFRLRMIAQTGRMWLDADAALIQPLAPSDDYFFVGGDHPSFGRCINNFALFAPQESPFIREAVSYFDHPRKFLKHMAWHRSARLLVKRMLYGQWNLSQFRWGVFGMGFLTELVQKHDLWRHARIADPSVAEGLDSLLRPLSEETMNSTVIAHFFSSGVKRDIFAHIQPPRGSIYERLVMLYA